jgi:hypothetical protein
VTLQQIIFDTSKAIRNRLVTLKFCDSLWSDISVSAFIQLEEHSMWIVTWQTKITQQLQNSEPEF